MSENAYPVHRKRAADFGTLRIQWPPCPDIAGGTYPEDIGALAHCALIYEVLTAPKPGLVDRFNSGAHRDMDINTFIRSADAISPFLKECAEIGMKAGSPEGLLERLRPVGIAAEREMYRATEGANTHKGAIFSLGILCAAAGLGGRAASAAQLCGIAGRIAADSVGELEKSCAAKTAGELLYREYGCRGIRGEVAAGFPSLVNVAWPCFLEAFLEGHDMDYCGVITLLKLICTVEDTTMLKRSGGRENMERYRALARDALESGDLLKGAAEADKIWSRNGISAGGCADLLSATFFLFLFEEWRSGGTAFRANTPLPSYDITHQKLLVKKETE